MWPKALSRNGHLFRSLQHLIVEKFLFSPRRLKPTLVNVLPQQTVIFNNSFMYQLKQI